MKTRNRRQFIRDLGISAAAIPFIAGLPSLASTASSAARKQRLVLMFSPNGTIPDQFWPAEEGEEFTLKRILQPLEPFKKQLLTLRGVSNKVRGDGDGHMRGMSCLLTGIELFPGNIQGGSDTPAGWAKGISIDQEIRNFFQGRDETRTRLGSLELGVNVPRRADPWTRWSYAGPNKPVAPVDDPYQVFEKLYGRMKDKETLKSILDDVREDLRKVSAKVSSEDKKLLDEHLTLVREMERDLQSSDQKGLNHPVPELEPHVQADNDNMPKVSRMQIDLLVNSLANDMARVATLQYTNSVGQARMRWLGIEEGHHSLSHDPDLNEPSQEKLTKINVWFCEQLAYLARKLSETKEPGGEGTLLDNTLLLWTNELGKGNAHWLDNIPFVLVGNGCNFRMGRSLKYDKVAHNRLWLSIAHAMGHNIETFGNPKLSQGGPLDLS
ncbi:MAG TPA: DUF1552 domain-containing protein [Bryobacteraceae bacterium]|nr:DUF1552 domain-containing protein [Bryobacteraceae bacterium]